MQTITIETAIYPRAPLTPRRRAPRTGIAAALAVLVAALPAAAQQAAGKIPDSAETEARFEQAFAAALDLPSDAEPVNVLQAWGLAVMSAVVADRVRAMSVNGLDAPAGDAAAIKERVLARWQRERPESGGPALYRAMEIQSPEARRDAVLGLLERFPDDSLVVSQAIMLRMQAGEAGRAIEIAETFLRRNPDHPLSYRLALQAAGSNRTLHAAALRRWAEAATGDPRLLASWLRDGALREDAPATERLLDAFFARPPASDSPTLEVCRLVAQRGIPAYTTPASACLAHIATDDGAPAALAEEATKAMAELAAAHGDWDRMIAALDELEPAARIRALAAAAERLEAPARCGERMSLLATAAEGTPGDDRGAVAIARALRACADLPAAQELFLSLLRRAAPAVASDIVHTRLMKVNGVYRGELPASTADLLEARLAAAPGEGKLYAALDPVYQVDDPRQRRAGLLRRWHAHAPGSMTADAVIALAWARVAEGEIEEARAVLEGRLAERFDQEVGEMLFTLYATSAGPERTERFVGELIASDRPERVRLGHTLAARVAAADDDLAAAEASYWRALEGDYPPREVAVELLALRLGQDDDAAVQALAERLCATTALKSARTTMAACAAELLAEAGGGHAAAALIAAEADALPEDLRALESLSNRARASGQTKVAERAARRLIELDPDNEGYWVGLGGLLEKAGRYDEVAGLLARARGRFKPPPISLVRTAGRSLTASGRPREAIELLLEGRATLPDTAGSDFSRSWIDHDLQAAYRAYGLEVRAASAPHPPLWWPSVEAMNEAAAAGDPGGMTGRAFTLLGPAAEPEACAEGRRLLEAAARAGQPIAQATLGKHLFYGLGPCVTPEPAAARRWLEAALAAEQPNAAFDLAMALLAAPADDGERKRAGLLLEDAAGRGDALAAETLALLHAAGLGLPRDPGKAAAFLRQANRLGSDGLPRLAVAVERSAVFREFFGRAVARLAGLAESGDRTARAWYAWLTMLGRTGATMDARTVGWVRQAAEQGDPLALRVMRTIYQRVGVEADADEARRWQRRCAEAGNAFCMMFEGQDLIEGEAVPRDLEAGLRWLERAAETGNWWAVQSLGRHLDEARHGLARDVEGAAHFKQVLAERGDPAAAGWLAYHGYR